MPAQKKAVAKGGGEQNIGCCAAREGDQMVNAAFVCRMDHNWQE